MHFSLFFYSWLSKILNLLLSFDTQCTGWKFRWRVPLNVYVLILLTTGQYVSCSKFNIHIFGLHFYRVLNFNLPTSPLNLCTHTPQMHTRPRGGGSPVCIYKQLHFWKLGKFWNLTEIVSLKSQFFVQIKYSFVKKNVSVETKTICYSAKFYER